MVHKMENVKLLNNHESVTSQETEIEMEEYSDEEDEVFVRGNINHSVEGQFKVTIFVILYGNCKRIENVEY